ncbi:hypothetical protein NEDG_01872 [Nematocida displodere]|uniref:Uncharacterized protein n=1 Tax=Nematocida displodere TaxID=1805483 RepID=A0A177EGV1_9MICR|nr:hypothetical protein NEDG_01872 [Nematocida displodere]
MSKFFEGLDGDSTKKVAKVIEQAFEDESEEEQKGVSNKEKKLEEIEAVCREASLKKPKDVELFFKRLTKYNNHFAKEGLPDVLVDFLNESDTKNASSILKQRKKKFLEKYAVTEVVLEIKEETKKRKSFMEEINSALLVDDPRKRLEVLGQLEEGEGLSLPEKHRINLYTIGTLIEEGVGQHYTEITSRLGREHHLTHNNPEEIDLLKTRVGRYVRRLLKHLQVLERYGKEWSTEFEQLKEMASLLKPATDAPHKGVLEIEFFLTQTSTPTEEYPLFTAIAKIRALPYPEALSLFKELGERSEKPDEETTTDTVCHAKMTEELGHRAFHERDFDTAIDLLEKAFYSKTIWSTPNTEVLLSILCLCFEKRMKERRFFALFKEDLQLVGNNPLLLKTETPKEEIARAFIALRLGDCSTTEEILTTLVPAFECHALLKNRAIEILLG